MSSREPTSPKALLLFSLLCLWALTSTGFEALEFAESFRWQSTEGFVLDSEVQVAGASSQIEYQFRVDDRNYRSTRIAFAEFSGSGTWRKYLKGKYAPKNTVTVFYDPSNPHKSVLEKRIAPSGFLWFTVSLVGLTVVARRLEKIES